MPHEIELKLLLPADADTQLQRAPLLRDARPRHLRLDAVYFDTPDRLLRRHGMALRLRRTGKLWVQTLKAAHSARAGLSTRPEWESPARLVRGEPRLDLKSLGDTPLPALLAQYRSRRKLRPAFRVRVQRTVWEIRFRRSWIEVAMDRGRIEGERDGQRMTAPVAELELELKDGRPEDLIAAGLRLTGRGATSLALVPMVRGKAERGYLLVSGTPAPPTKASARGFVAALRPDMDSGAALRAIIAHGLDVLLANTEALRDVHAPEYVHQARVALRRMRSAVRLLDRKHKDFPETLAAELRWAARLLGAARDWDVMVSMTLPGLLAKVPRAERHLARPLLARAQRQRLKERREVVRAITSARFARLALRLHSWTLTPSPRGRRLVRLAPRLLGRAHRRLFDAARAFAGQSPERRHRVRILAKRLRYALDVMAVALPEEPTRRYVASLAELQDVLGELNDLAVARGSIEGLAAGQRARDVVQATLHEREAELLLDAETRLTQLRTRPRAWDVDAA